MAEKLAGLMAIGSGMLVMCRLRRGRIAAGTQYEYHAHHEADYDVPKRSTEGGITGGRIPGARDRSDDGQHIARIH